MQSEFKILSQKKNNNVGNVYFSERALTYYEQCTETFSTEDKKMKRSVISIPGNTLTLFFSFAFGQMI